MSRERPPFVITEESPTPIVRDFDLFLEAVEKPSAHLTKSRRSLDRATLYATDPLMRTFQTECHPRMDQDYYPLLNVFQNICLAARLHRLGYDKKKLRLFPSERLAEYRALSPTEKYLALLEVLWVDCEWEDLFVRHTRYCTMSMESLIRAFSIIAVGRKLDLETLSRERHVYRTRDVHQAIRLFSFFGFLDYTLKPEPERGYGYKGIIEVQSVTLSALGKAFMRVLREERPLELWNLPARQSFFAVPARFPGESVKADDGGVTKPTPFYKAFLPLLPPGSLANCLSRRKRKPKEQTFVVRVSLGSIWRTIALSSEHTLDDLHYHVQQAYSFDNDHLYAFYMDGKRYSRKAYGDPRADGCAPYADDAALGELDLFVGQRILYLFDFGDEWLFDVDLLEIRDTPHKGSPRLLEKRGESPEQYHWPDEE